MYCAVQCWSFCPMVWCGMMSFCGGIELCGTYVREGSGTKDIWTSFGPFALLLPLLNICTSFRSFPSFQHFDTKFGKEEGTSYFPTSTLHGRTKSASYSII